MKNRVLVLFLVLALFSCKKDGEIFLATTTSTENSGLLAYLLPVFEEESGYTVNVIAVGTGNAIRLGMDGNADVVMVHAKEREDKFVAEGYGYQRIEFMYNDFVVVGPKSDPAGIRDLSDVKSAFSKIKEKNCGFVSRGDDSGTHIKELTIWGDTSVDFSNYISAGAGMNAVLTIAHEKQAYCLTDRATYLSALNRLDLEILVEGDGILLNPYGIIVVSEQKHPHTNKKGAEAFVEFLISDKGQALINSYAINGEQLFFANYKKGE
ncbi:MAG: extracellular solute-binding protein [Spirochaetales bacterium]|nr:extracellular solute-binding protein [Spirochaetales bacterium]